MLETKLSDSTTTRSLPNRAERIAAAQKHLAEIEPTYSDARAAYERAKHALQCAEESFDVGERVKVTHLCRRGCCIEWEFTGSIEAVDQHSYLVRRDHGSLKSRRTSFEWTKTSTSEPTWEHHTDLTRLE